MFRTHRVSRRATVPLAAFCLSLGACSDSAPTPPTRVAQSAAAFTSNIHSANSDSVTLSDLRPEDRATLAQLRNLTTAYPDTAAARKAGWNVVVAHPMTGATCFTDPRLGAMGVHLLNPQILDGTVNPLQPEVLLYEPQKNGQISLVAVEYAVPYAITAADGPAPELFPGVPFHHNDTFGLWVIHAWHSDDNPSGFFTDWNPKVTCPFAGS